ncbi:queuosine precursor transporter [Fodinicurvata halophila]|uniref:Probable queuosine precursor transporter n=1 Tax=Fodinicurvata halophila TaxID=1419723 RepID=A0ABV8USH4_9PROT
MRAFDSAYTLRGFLMGLVAMTLLVTASNILVQYPINDFLTFGALTYPACFLVTDLCTRALGAQQARRVVLAGFAVAVLLSLVLATPRIALASGAAFLTAQLLDVFIFDRLRRAAWWQAPLLSSFLASAIDTALFFGLAFWGTTVPWVTLGLGDYGVKVALALVMLIPFRALIALIPDRQAVRS